MDIHTSYDEDLGENTFFLLLQSQKYRLLFLKAQAAGCVVAVPRTGSLNLATITSDDVTAHILNWNEERCTTFSGKAVEVNGKELVFEDKGQSRKAIVLFEETFYNDDDKSYRVICLDSPLSGDLIAEEEDIVLDTLPRCDEYLTSLGKHGPKLRNKVQQMCKQFCDQSRIKDLNVNSLAASGLSSINAAKIIVNETKNLYNNILNTVLRDTGIKKLSKNAKTMHQLKLALETFVMAQLHPLLWDILSEFFAEDDRSFNKCIRNLSHVTRSDMHLLPELTRRMPEAITKISFINSLPTPLEKLFCVRRALSVLTDAEGDSLNAGENNNDTKPERKTTVISADELVPLISFLMMKADISNWQVNLEFMTLFRFSGTLPEQFAYLLVSLEAATQHLQSNELASIQWGAHLSSPDKAKNGVTSSSINDSTNLRLYFNAVAAGDVGQVEKMLKPNIPEEVEKLLCHPLCECERCKSIKTSYKREKAIVTIESRDERGSTALHIAARLGAVDVVNSLLDLGAEVDAKDEVESTPLHMASQRDNVNCVLVLLSQSADVDAKDNDGYSALHYCAEYGHAKTAKVLLFQSPMPNVNVVNNRGDTPLHLAAKWGFVTVVDLLLFHGAKRILRNSKGQTPTSVTTSPIVMQALQSEGESSTFPDRGVSPEPWRRRGTNKNTSASLPSPWINVEEDPPTHIVIDPDSPARASGVSTLPVVFDPDSLVVPKRKKSLRRWTGTWFGGDKNPQPLDESAFKDDLDLFFEAIEENDQAFVQFALTDKMESPMNGDEVPQKKEDKVCHPLCQCTECMRASTHRSFRSQISVPQLVAGRNADNYTALHIAALHGRSEIAQLLIFKGASLDGTTPLARVTPLHCAAQYNHAEVVDLLVKTGCETHVQDFNGNTPLHFAAANGHSEVAEILIDAMENLNVQNSRGDTALHNAAKWGYVTMTGLLVEGGASPTIINARGLTPKMEARGDDVLLMLTKGGTMNKPTTIKVMNAAIDMSFLNGTYVQVGLLRKLWKPDTGSMESSTKDDLAPVFQHEKVISGDSPYVGKTPIIYFDGYKTAWNIAFQIGVQPLAYSASDSKHPVFNTSAWSVFDGESYRVDIDLDIIADETRYTTSDADADQLSDRIRSGSVRGRSASVVADAKSEAFKQLEAKKSGMGYVLTSHGRRLTAAGSPSLHRRAALKAITAFEGEFPLDEVDTNLIKDRSAPDVTVEATVNYSIRSFDKVNRLRRIPHSNSVSPDIVDEPEMESRSRSKSIPIPTNDRIRFLFNEEQTWNSTSGSYPMLHEPPPMSPQSGRKTPQLFIDDQQIVEKLSKLPSVTRMTFATKESVTIHDV